MSREPRYDILERYKKIELRMYEPFIVAEVESTGDRKTAVRSGFKTLANYIFGNNSASVKMPMSVPVTQQRVEHVWKIRFALTHASDLNDLPQPNNKLVKLASIPQKKIAAIKFSGTVNQEKLERHTNELRDFADSHKWTLHGHPILAFYNPPWTLPFLRRNEVLFEILK